MSPQAVQVYNTFLALLALVALAAAASLTSYRIWRGPEAAQRISNPAVLWAAWVVAAVATVGSLIYSEVIHFVPCRLCWFQRIAMYPMSVVLLVGAVRRDVAARFYALPLALTGLAISIWHNIVQLFPAAEGGSCDPAVPCSAKYVNVFDFISIPFMAGAGFTLIAVLLLFYVRPSNE
ncbi:MAG: disulfide oxidoreductase [Acidimicrobiia bacterium]|nr:disulfide oxidoreductase [Acidimicrobiia bacterium]